MRNSCMVIIQILSYNCISIDYNENIYDLRNIYTLNTLNISTCDIPGIFTFILCNRREKNK